MFPTLSHIYDKLLIIRELLHHPSHELLKVYVFSIGVLVQTVIDERIEFFFPLLHYAR